MGAAKPLDKPARPGTGFKVLGEDDGGVANLSLLIDLEDLLARATRGPMAKMTLREQKVSLTQLLFSKDDDCAGSTSWTRARRSTVPIGWRRRARLCC